MRLARPPRPRRFSPAEIPGLLLWLRPEELQGLKDGDGITRWHDASGSARHATDSAGASNPAMKLTTAGQRGFGGSAHFDGVNDKLDLPNITQNVPCTFMAAVFGSAGGTAGILIAHVLGWYQRIATNWGMYLNQEVDSGQAPVAGPPVWIVAAVARAANDIDMVTNGSSKVTRTNGSGGQARGATRLGADPTGVQWMSGDVGELLLWDHALSLSERKPVEQYLYSRFGDPYTYSLGAV